MVNIPHLSSPMAGISNLLQDSILLSKVDISNLKAIILLLVVLLHLNSPTVAINSNLLLSSTAHLPDLHKAIMAPLPLINSPSSITAHLLDLRKASMELLPLSNMELLLLNSMVRRQFSQLRPRWATDANPFNGMVAPMPMLYARP